MLRIIQNTSATGAKSYYSTADYYSEGQELEGIWRGKGAARLGLSGTVRKEAWDALCDNRHPATAEPLSPRRKQDRRVGYDFNFHVPKSVSLLYGLTEDARILEAFRESVDQTMREIEAEVKTRVRKSGKNEDRLSRNLVWGEFIHTTARPVNGIPDPHLHAHCFSFNLTFDDKENRWKAAQFGDLKRDASYFEAKFHSRMARRLAELGLPVEQTRNGWEIAGISKASLNKFSRRTALIEKIAHDKGITSDAEKSAVGAKTREKKQKSLSMAELRKEWRSRLSGDEQAGLSRIAEGIGGTPHSQGSRHSRDRALLRTTISRPGAGTAGAGDEAVGRTGFGASHGAGRPRSETHRGRTGWAPAGHHPGGARRGRAHHRLRPSGPRNVPAIRFGIARIPGAQTQ